MLSRFHHILVPVEATGGNSSAVEIAFELAAQNRAAVSFLHVIRAIDPGSDPPDEETTDFYNHMRRQAESEMERMSQRFLDADLKCEVKVWIGDPLMKIVEFSKQHRVDLIVMASHRVDPDHLAETWGTLSYKVSVLSESSVLLVK